MIKGQDLDVVAKVLSRVAVLAEPKVYLFWENPTLNVSAPLAKKLD